VHGTTWLISVTLQQRREVHTRREISIGSDCGTSSHSAIAGTVYMRANEYCESVWPRGPARTQTKPAKRSLMLRLACGRHHEHQAIYPARPSHACTREQPKQTDVKGCGIYWRTPLINSSGTLKRRGLRLHGCDGDISGLQLVQQRSPQQAAGHAAEAVYGVGGGVSCTPIILEKNGA
jgi:hypothetical protein